MRFAVIAIALLACSGGSECKDACTSADTAADTTPVQVTRIDEGQACLLDATHVTVTIDSCASSCIVDVATSCAAEVVGTDVIVTSEGSWGVPTEGSCDAACNVVTASCELAGLGTGPYVLVYGTFSSDFDAPPTSKICAGEYYDYR